MEKSCAELVLVPCMGVGHLVSMVELAKHLVERDSRISITILIMNLHSDEIKIPPSSSLISPPSSPRIRLVDLPQLTADASSGVPPLLQLFSLMQKVKPLVKEAVQELIVGSNSEPADSPRRLAGIVVDMFCTPIIDVANELGVPSYGFYTSGAQFFAFSLHILNLEDEQGMDTTKLKDSDTELVAPGFLNPIPAKVLPDVLLENKEVAENFLGHARRIGETKGILVNTFAELESAAVDYLSHGKFPPVYPVGPILKISADPEKSRDIVSWLDDQPPSSVVFLCFGSMGSFHVEQVREIARALEQSGHRFLWSVRQGGPPGKYVAPTDYANLEQVLPEGFLDRTAGSGRVIGWAPQAEVLAHPAVGGFVSHCGWNSTLESLWFGVPMATWPLYAEQQFNAFSLLKEFDLAVEIKMDYRNNPMSDKQMTISADEIERGIRALMGLEDEKKRKVKEMSEKSRKALEEGGSSFTNLGCFIDEMFKNMP